MTFASDNSSPLPGKESSAGGDPPDGGVGDLSAWLESQAAPIYRFQLIRSGDPTLAENRTALTLRLARERLPAHPAGDGEARLWRIARQVSKKTAGSSAHAPARGFADNEPEAHRIQQALIPPVIQAFERLPQRQTELLSLRLFGGLDAALAAAALDGSQARLESSYRQGLARLAESAGLDAGMGPLDPAQIEADLRELAARIQPDARFLASLAEALQSPLPAGQPRTARFTWPRALADGWRRYAWAPAALIGLALLAASIWTTPPRSSEPTPTATPPAAVSRPIPVTGGYLQPVDQTACEDLRYAVDVALHMKTDLNQSAPFLDPLSTGVDHNGAGCEISTSGTGADFQGIDPVIQAIIPLMVGRGYQVDGTFSSNAACPACFQFPNDWSGKGLLFNRPDGRAMLAVGWRPIDPNLCQPGADPNSCALPSDAQVYTLRLDLATDPAREALASFFKYWQGGDGRALDLLSQEFHLRLTSLSDLDHLAGIDRAEFTSAQVNWHVRQTTAQDIRLSVSIYPPLGNDPSIPKGFTRLALAMENTPGGWRVENIWRIDFNRELGDSAFIADAQGRVLELSLDDGSTVALTGPSFYLPPQDGSAFSPDSVARLSPDGQSLLFSMPAAVPGNPGLGGTWLLSTGGGGARQIDSFPLHAAWAPDSRRLAYRALQDPQAIYLYDTANGANEVLTRVQGPIRGLAWSPDGRLLAVSFPIPAGKGAGAGIEVTILNSATGQDTGRVDFAGVQPADAANPDLELQWTAVSDELWYTPAMAAFDIGRGRVEPLVASGLAGYRALQASGGPRMPQVSPDGAEIAYASSSDTSGNWISVRTLQTAQPTARPRQLVSSVSGPVAGLAWTANSQRLIIAGGTATPQPVWRLDPSSGDTHTLASSAYFIGVRSALERQSLHLAAQAQVKSLSSPPVDGGLVQDDFPAFRLRLSVPAGWSVSQPQGYANWGQIASISISGPAGLTSVEDYQLVMRINQDLPSWVIGKAPGLQTAENRLSDPVWAQIQVGGQVAYRLTKPLTPGGPLVIQIPMPTGTLTITKYPFTGSQDKLFEQILESIEFN